MISRPGLSLGNWLISAYGSSASEGLGLRRMGRILSLMKGIKDGLFEGLAHGAPVKELNDVFVNFVRSAS